jgi:hypothetical protein
MTTRTIRLSLLLAVAFGFATAADLRASEWNDRTIIKVSEPVMVPGATLQPGTYVFKLMSSDTNRHIVQVLTEDEARVVTTTNAVPTKRMDPKGDTVLKFNPTESGTPAIKAWFYPGTVYGHEFVYPDEQARQIAQRTKTIVLSTEAPESDMQKGTLYTYDAEGRRGEWREDTARAREWDAWYRDQKARATAGVAAPGTKSKQESTAPIVDADPQGMSVTIDQLEDNAAKYMGQTINVDAEVERVLGPRLFTIDEPNWGDLEGEMLVFMDTNLAALVREDDRVTVTGTMKPFMRAEIERELGWLGRDEGVEVDLSAKPILVATRIVGGTSNLALVIRAGAPKADTPVGTTGGGSADAAISSLDTISAGDDDLVGRRVELDDVAVASVARDGGFWVRAADGTHVFVMPSGPDVTAAAGRNVSIEGIVLQMPGTIRNDLHPSGEWNDEIYVFATELTQ